MCSHVGCFDRIFPVQTFAAFTAPLPLGGKLWFESLHPRFFALVFGSQRSVCTQIPWAKGGCSIGGRFFPPMATFHSLFGPHRLVAAALAAYQNQMGSTSSCGHARPRNVGCTGHQPRPPHVRRGGLGLWLSRLSRRLAVTKGARQFANGPANGCRDFCGGCHGRPGQYCRRFFCFSVNRLRPRLWDSFLSASHIGVGISNHGFGFSCEAPRLDGRTAWCSAAREGAQL